MGFLKQIKTHRLRTVKTFVLFMSFFSMGLNVASVGPCLLDLQILVNSTLQEAASILPAKSIGFLIGSVAYGLVNSYTNIHMMMVFLLTVMIVSLAWVPYCTTYIFLIVLFFINGTATGALDNACNSWIIYLWGEKNGPFMQVLHFCFGFGTFVFPFVAEKFIVPLHKPKCGGVNSNITTNGTDGNGTDCCKNHSSSYSGQNGSVSNSYVITSNSKATNVTSPDLNLNNITNIFEPCQIEYTRDDLKIEWPFIIIAICHLLALILFIFIYIKQPTNKPHSSIKTRAEADEKKEQPLKVKLYFLFAILMFFFSLVGLEIPFGSLITTFAVKSDLQLDKSTSSFITSGYWGTYTFFRLLTLIFTKFLTSQEIIIFHLCLIGAANMIMVLFANDFVWAMWSGSLIMGAGTSALFPAALTFCNEVIEVTPMITSMILIFSALGDLAMPVIISFYIDAYPDVFLWVNFACTVVIFITFAFSIDARKKILKQP